MKRKMKVRNAIVWMVVLALMVSGCSTILAHPAIDVTGFTEIINYKPNESITLRTVIVNNMSDTVSAMNSFIRIPWGSGPLYSEGVCYSNVSTVGKPFFPNAKQAHAYNFDYYRGCGAYVFFQGFTIDAKKSKELVYTLKINDWTGQCPTGDTWHQFPYSMWMTGNEDVFMDTFVSTISVGNESKLLRLDPRKGTFGDMPPEYEVGTFRITSSMLPHRYGAFPNITQVYKDSTESVNVSVFNGSGLGKVTDATVSLEGCGVHENTSIYPYEFNITPKEYGKIRIIANWTEYNISMRGEGFISVTKPDGLVDWNNVTVTRTPMPDNSTKIRVDTSNTEGREYIDKLLLTYSPADRPWAMQLTMDKYGDKYEATIEPFEIGRIVNYTITGFDIAGLWKEIANESFIVTPPPAIEVQVWTEPTEITPGNISIIFARVTETENKTPVSNVNVTFTTDFGMFTESRNDTYINTTNESGIAVAHFMASEAGTANITATEPTGVSNSTTIRVFIPTFEFDTRGGDYPSIPGTFNGTITPSHKVIANKLYTYPCAGTGGHSEYMWIGNLSWNISSETWEGYTRDWHNLTFNEPFVLEAGETYNYTIRTGSYPQIIHQHNLTTADGVITCTEFRDVNGVVHYDWIPAIRLFAQ